MVPTILSTTDEALQFKPEDRNCYTSEEVDLKYFRRSKGYKYSMQNCLYESVLESILDQCSCIPNFMSFKLENITYSVCRGTDLDCALDKIQNMGNEKLNLTPMNLTPSFARYLCPVICLKSTEKHSNFNVLATISEN